MCGITVSASLNGKPANRLLVPIMLSQMMGRGDCLPETGEVLMGAMGCNRLAIVDAEHGRQPVFNERGDVAVVYNGEIYNHRRLATELIRAGHRLSSACDTEILVHGYEEWGADLLPRLQGMYAFVVLDQPRRRIFAARDPFGIKPLYYSRRGDELLFASEMKALLRTGAVDIRAVPPGGFLDNGCESARQYLPRPAEIQISVDDAKKKLRRRLRDSVRSMLDTELPVAVLCSGGIDSSAVLFEATQTSAKVTAYAIGTSMESPDVAAALSVAEFLGVPFRPVLVEEAALLRSVPEVRRCK
jgi:asparagine synthase (glutamine-hydrolysing)